MYYTENLMIRPFDLESDKNKMLQWLNDDEFFSAMSSTPPLGQTKEDVKKFIEARQARTNDLPCFVLCMKPKEEDRPSALPANEDPYLHKDGSPRYPAIGNLNIFAPGFSARIRSVKIGIGIEKQYRGRGLGTEALEWVLEFIFDSLNMHKVELDAIADNPMSVHVYEKVGFVHEGRRRHAMFQAGKYADLAQMGILESEWRSRHPPA